MHKHLPVTLAVVLTILLFTGCQNKQKEEKPKQVTRTLPLRVVHSPEIAGPLGSLMDIFFLGAPILPDGSLVKIELISEPALSAAKKLARGALKTHVWLTPTATLAGLVNNTRVNLGAEQTGCVRLFETPLVTALKSSARQVFDPSAQGTIGLRQVFASASSASSATGKIQLNHPTAAVDAAGFIALTHMARYAAGDQPLDTNTLKNPEVLQNLSALESYVSLYSPGHAEALTWLANTEKDPPALAIVPEQSVTEYNKKAPADSRLEVLVPEGKTSVLDYSLCTSSADWVTPAHQAAIKMLTKFMLSQGAMELLMEAGFRPPTAVKTGLESVATTPLPQQQGPVYTALPAVSGPTAGQLFLNWPKVKRPAADIVVIDTSGSTEGDILALQKNLATKVFARNQPNELKGLISYATEVSVLSEPVSDGARLLPVLDGLRSLGSSLMHDAIRSALETAKSPNLASYQKRIIVFTDGPDRNSTTSIKALTDLLKYSASKHDTYVYVLAVSSENSNYQDLKEAIRSANGYFKQAALIDLNDSFTELLSTFD